ncbi:IclR family transcriptional regulator [Roseomonas marmotae]|uniref:IclR family transcriptional regulator n=1 Tax=Roseomonas marmotae TaxID=2768161 RepID=A0ABS3KEK9_9PROT|nr:IclR family transcriptional regulator [Roseomonas marmotae]MBO1075880.1 IclR family transcriptional regulator [Roseomonas marmotae]QTI81933.1 IclR family transcriptional regulator [Roseomonas marmotae]
MLSKGKDDTAAREAGDRLFLQSVERALRVLEAFGRQARPMSLAELAAAAGLDKSATQRVAHTLQALGYLERSASGPGLVPGKRLLDRSFDYLRMNPLVERATPVLQELRRTVQERVDLSLFDDTDVVYAVRLQSKRETFFATLVGRRLPTFCSSGGRAILAALPEAEAEDILARSDRRPMTPKTITDLPGIRRKIAEARRDGFALAVEEALLGEIALGTAVRDRDGRPVAAIHVAGSLSEWDAETFRRRVGPVAIEAARALSQGPAIR